MSVKCGVKVTEQCFIKQVQMQSIYPGKFTPSGVLKPLEIIHSPHKNHFNT